MVDMDIGDLTFGSTEPTGLDPSYDPNFSELLADSTVISDWPRSLRFPLIGFTSSPIKKPSSLPRC